MPVFYLLTRPSLRTLGLTLCLSAAALLVTPAEAATKAASKAKAKAKPRAVQPHKVKKEAPPQPYGHREDVMRFASELAEREGWDATALQTLQAQLAQARLLPVVQRLIMPPPAGTAKDWAAYRARFVEPKRIQAGLAFWQANEAALTRAEAQYGVPAALIVGLIGVETYYGQVMGSFRIIDALATLSFDFPPGRKDRSAFFREELRQFIILARREGADPLGYKGSYAGAMGLPQFMPGSWNRYAVDFDGDGHIDLAGNAADAIGSVAHYLVAHGWQRGMPSTYEVRVPVDSVDRATLLAPDILPSFTAQQFAERGAELSPAGQQHSGLMALVELQMGEAAPVYVAGTANFYALTRYNWSSYYAMAVLDLGEAVSAQRLASNPGE